MDRQLEVTWAWLRPELARVVPMFTAQELEVWKLFLSMSHPWRANATPYHAEILDWQGALARHRRPPPLPDTPLPHELLGVTMPPKRDELKAAFRRLVLHHHPDKGGSPADFIRINAAYDALTPLAV